jgi:hypothetical protein
MYLDAKFALGIAMWCVCADDDVELCILPECVEARALSQRRCEAETPFELEWYRT